MPNDYEIEYNETYWDKWREMWVYKCIVICAYSSSHAKEKFNVLKPNAVIRSISLIYKKG